MAFVTKNEIIQKMDKMKTGETLKFRLSPTFGGRLVMVEFNPLFGQEKQRKFLMRIGDDEGMIKRAEPLLKDDKSKKIADWIAGRSPSWVTGTPPEKKAA